MTSFRTITSAMDYYKKRKDFTEAQITSEEELIKKSTNRSDGNLVVLKAILSYVNEQIKNLIDDYPEYFT